MLLNKLRHTSAVLIVLGVAIITAYLVVLLALPLEEWLQWFAEQEARLLEYLLNQWQDELREGS